MSKLKEAASAKRAGGAAIMPKLPIPKHGGDLNPSERYTFSQVSIDTRIAESELLEMLQSGNVYGLENVENPRSRFYGDEDREEILHYQRVLSLPSGMVIDTGLTEEEFRAMEIKDITFTG